MNNVQKPSCLSAAVLGFCLSESQSAKTPTYKHLTLSIHIVHESHHGRVELPIVRPSVKAHKPKALSRLALVRKASSPEVNRDRALRQGLNLACVSMIAEANAIATLTDLLDDTAESLDDAPAAGPSAGFERASACYQALDS